MKNELSEDENGSEMIENGSPMIENVSNDDPPRPVLMNESIHIRAGSTVALKNTHTQFLNFSSGFY